MIELEPLEKYLSLCVIYFSDHLISIPVHELESEIPATEDTVCKFLRSTKLHRCSIGMNCKVEAGMVRTLVICIDYISLIKFENLAVNPFDDIIELSVRNRYNTVYGLRIFAVRIIRRIYNSLLSHDFPLACCTVVFILFDLCRSYLKTDIENNMISILITEMFVVRDIVIMILGSKFVLGISRAESRIRPVIIGIKAVVRKRRGICDLPVLIRLGLEERRGIAVFIIYPAAVNARNI